MDKNNSYTISDTAVKKGKFSILRYLAHVTFGLCFLGTVVGIPIAVTYANGGKESKESAMSTPALTTTTASSLETTEANTTTTTSRTTTTVKSLTTLTTTTTTTLPVEGWREWTEWTSCSVSCGVGEVVRSRECISHTPGNSANVCDGYQGNDEVEVNQCFSRTCLSGEVMVYDLADMARLEGVDDNLFLNRYALAVTNNGETINLPDSETTGYGVWRLTEDQFNRILHAMSKTRAQKISGNLLSNFNLVCHVDMRSIGLEAAIKLANKSPCFSMVALTTYLVITGNYPVPLDPDAQEIVLNQVSDQMVIQWKDCMSIELEIAQNQCTQSDIDFDFVVDSSGSVGVSNWELTMELIGTMWIKTFIVPNGSKTCGNHVAGRWFSTGTERFLDFTPPEKEEYAPLSYADYVGDTFINFPYQDGGTDTALALRSVKKYDMKLCRNGLKYVMVFTDGASNNNTETKSEAKELHKVADRTYAFGIGTGINEKELHDIASNDSFVGDMSSFDDLESYVRIFVLVQKGCYTADKKAYRAVNLEKEEFYGPGLTFKNLVIAKSIVDIHE